MQDKAHDDRCRRGNSGGSARRLRRRRRHGAGGLPFRDTFRPKPDAGWRWVREDPNSWRVGQGGLEVRILPGNNWGPANDAKNVLVRPAPDVTKQPVEITASVRNKPTGQWEQVDLCW